jgi:hypothetical protein
MTKGGRDATAKVMKKSRPVGLLHKKPKAGSSPSVLLSVQSVSAQLQASKWNHGGQSFAVCRRKPG